MHDIIGRINITEQILQKKRTQPHSRLDVLSLLKILCFKDSLFRSEDPVPSISKTRADVGVLI